MKKKTMATRKKTKKDERDASSLVQAISSKAHERE